ncbi:MAG: hypothetical protein CMH79_04515 [Nitrospinae bacterium]|nr:hypothetical protein [Nitrospinota bacterium]
MDVFKQNDTDILEYDNQTALKKMQLIEHVSTYLNNESQYTYNVVDENGKQTSVTKSWIEAKRDLLNPANREELESKYNEVQTEINEAATMRPNWLEKNASYDAAKDQVDDIQNREKLLNITIGEMNDKYTQLHDLFRNSSIGSEWNTNYVNGMPSIFGTDSWVKGMDAPGVPNPKAGINTENAHKSQLDEMEQNPGIYGMGTKDRIEQYKASLGKTMLSKDEYVKRFTQWANAHVNDLDSPYHYDPRAKMIKDTWGLGLGLSYLPEKGWVADDAKIQTEAEESYDEQKKAYNLYMSRGPASQGGGESPIYLVDKALRGQRQGGAEVTKNKGYKFIYDHGVQTPESVEQLKHLWAAVRGPKANRMVRLGNESGNMEGGNETKAETALDWLETDIGLTFGDDNDKTGAPRFSITYSESMGGKGANNEYAGYVITLTPQYAKHLKATKEDDANELFDAGVWKDNSLTVFVDKSVDSNPYRKDANIVSHVDVGIKADGEVTYENPKGGGVRFYENSHGQVMEQAWDYFFDGNPKSETFGDYIKTIHQPRIINATGETMNQYVQEVKKQQDAFAADNKKLENETKTLYPDAVKKLNMENAAYAQQKLAEDDSVARSRPALSDYYNERMMRAWIESGGSVTNPKDIEMVERMNLTVE